MNALIGIARRSAWNRRFTLGLVVLTIALATLLLLAMHRVRAGVRDSFSSAVSGTDLIVGPRVGGTQLLLYSVFHIGSAANTMSWTSVQALAGLPQVDWVVPLSLGDSHHGYPVLATSPDYFAYFRYGNRQALSLSKGRPFQQLFDAVIGSEVAQSLHYRLGGSITLAHGSGKLVHEHADKPFRVVGILAPTGTPVDRTVLIGLQAMQAIHLDWVAGAPMPGFSIAPGQVRKFDLKPRQVTAVLVGLKNRSAVLDVQRWGAAYKAEALTAILPGVALDELWQLVSVVERALMAIAALLALVSFIGLVAVILAGLDQRRRELAVLRAVGASLRHVVLLLALEGIMISTAGVAAGIALATVTVAAAGPWLQSAYGIRLSLTPPTADEWTLIVALVLAGFAASLFPGLRAYRLSLIDGLSPRI